MLAAEKAIANFITNGHPNIEALLILGHGLKKEQIIDYLAPLKGIPICVRTKAKTDLIMPYVIDFVSQFSTLASAEEIKYLDELIQVSPDLLVFGEEIYSKTVKKIYDSDVVISRFGGPVGELYYSLGTLNTLDGSAAELESEESGTSNI